MNQNWILCVLIDLKRERRNDTLHTQTHAFTAHSMQRAKAKQERKCVKYYTRLTNLTQDQHIRLGFPFYVCGCWCFIYSLENIEYTTTRPEQGAGEAEERQRSRQRKKCTN